MRSLSCASLVMLMTLSWTAWGSLDTSLGPTISDLAFLGAEIAGDQLHFNAISRRGQTVDSGVLARRK